MGKTADSTGVQIMIINTLHKEVIAERLAVQSSLLKYINGKLTGKEMCTSNRDDCSLEKIVKNLGAFHRETEGGFSASSTNTHSLVRSSGKELQLLCC